MTKLTRYTNFEELKSDVEPSTANLIATDQSNQISELEAFLNLLRIEMSTKKEFEKNKIDHGKQHS